MQSTFALRLTLVLQPTPEQRKWKYARRTYAVGAVDVGAVDNGSVDNGSVDNGAKNVGRTSVLYIEILGLSKPHQYT